MNKKHSNYSVQFHGVVIAGPREAIQYLMTLPLLLFFSAGCFAQNTQELPLPKKIEIFFDKETSVVQDAKGAPSGVVIAYYDLTRFKEVNPKINEELAKLPLEAAKVKARELATSKGVLFGVDVVADAKKAFAGASKLTRYGLTKIPAVVFDNGVSVVYGVADLGQALQLYGKWQQERAKKSSQ